MKITIEGSALANRLKPLATPVRQHEGRDFDKLSIAIAEDGEKKYLNAHVVQPSYMAYMSLNLSGEVVDVSAGEEPSLGAQPIDADAVACGANEMFVMKATDMANLTRNVGRYCAEFVLTDDGVEAKIGDSSLFRKHCKRMNSALCLPQLFEREMTPQEALNAFNYRLMGQFGENSGFCNALDTAIRICRLSGSRGVLKTQAIHISLSAKHIKIEAVSGNGAIVYSTNRDVTMLNADEFKQEHHLAISLPAAESLRNMCAGSGNAIGWSYRSSDKSLVFMAKPYCIIIKTEEVAACEFPDCSGYFDAVSMDCRSMLNILQRVKVSGNSKVYFSLQSEGGMDIYSEDLAVEDFIVCKPLDHGNSDIRMCLPVDTLLAALKGFQDQSIVLSYRVHNEFVVLSSRDDVSAMVYVL